MNHYHCNNQKNYCNEQDSINQFYQNQNFSNGNEVLSETNEFFDFINAASLGELKGVVNYLQKQFCNVNLSDSSGWTALMCAANYGHYNVIKALLDHGANTNLKEFKHGRTALMLAASNGHTRCIEMLVGQGKADIRLKDLNGFTAAYYATHYGHGNNKIIARLLRIPYNSQYANYNLSSNSINKSVNNSNIDSANYSNERYNLFLQNHNAALKENNELNQSNLINSDYYNERCFSADTNTNQVSLVSSNQGLNEILNRNMPKPRPIFKLRQRRSSPVSQHMVDVVKEKQRHSFSGASQSYYLSNSLRTNSLSIDCNRYSPNDLLTDQSFPSLQKNQNVFQYDSVFESPQSSASERQSFSEKSKLDSNYFNFDNLAINNMNEINQKKKSRSTLLSNGSNQSELSDSSNQLDSLEEKNVTETKFSNLATTLDEFLAQLGLEELGELFKKKNIDLYTFLSLSELDFKEYGINDLENLATLISGQLKFKELIGVRSSDSMNFITFLGNQLEKAKKEIESLKIENQLYKISLITI